MPGKTQRLQELVSGLNGEVAAMAVGPKHGVVVCLIIALTQY